jgi:Transposase
MALATWCGARKARTPPPATSSSPSSPRQRRAGSGPPTGLESTTRSGTVRTHRAGILAAIRLGINNARVEVFNNKVRLITRRAYGFHSAQAALALVMLACGPITLCPPHDQTLVRPHSVNSAVFWAAACAPAGGRRATPAACRCRAPRTRGVRDCAAGAAAARAADGDRAADPLDELMRTFLETSSVETSRRFPCRVLAGVTAGVAVSTYGVV